MYFEFRYNAREAADAMGIIKAMVCETAYDKKVAELGIKIGWEPKYFNREGVRVARWEKILAEETYGGEDLSEASNDYADAFRYARAFTQAAARDPQEALHDFISIMQQFKGRI